MNPVDQPLTLLPVAIEDEMKSSFMDYAMSVIVARALPDARDGLKPVHRRILYAQHILNNTATRPYIKCARVVGDVIGKYHPHGDASVYDALVRLAQSWNMRYPLIDGQGNFGSVDPDPAAAYRYTECRMTRLTAELLADIDKETVDWQPNYDDKDVEPTVLPTRIPNLLVNGSSGIAVGMATNIPPHNLREVVDGAIALIGNPAITIPELMQIIPGPDFPTAGFIYGRNGIRQAYETGRGQLTLRARATIEENEKTGRSLIAVTEIPYQLGTDRLIEKIVELIKEKRLEGVSDLRNESDRDGMRIVIELRKDAVPQVVLNQLWKLTPLETTFGVNMLAIVEGRPKLLTIKDALARFVDHRRDVVARRCRYELRQAQERAHILEGLKIALDHLDAVIALIRASRTVDEAQSGLMETFGLSERQSKAILEMRLQRLTGLERDKIVAELEATLAEIARLEAILADEALLMALIVGELEAVRDQFGDERRTVIEDAVDEISLEDMIAQEDMVVTASHSGYVKRNPISLYRAQKRGGRGITGAGTTEEDFIAQLFVASTHDHILMFTNKGRAYAKRVYEIPQGGRATRGKALVNLLELQEAERVVEMQPVREFSEGAYVVMATRKGVVKKTALTAFQNIRSSGIIALSIDEDDDLVDVRITEGTFDVLIGTQNGMAIRFDEERVRPMGRTARGVRGIALRESSGDAVVGMAAIRPDSDETLITVCERGYGKRTPLADYPIKNRGGYGVITIKTTERNGKVVGVRIVRDDDDLMIITDRGKLIRMPVSGIPLIGRNTQGVRLIRLEEGEKVVAVERLAEKAEGEDEGAEGVEVAAPVEAPTGELEFEEPADEEPEPEPEPEPDGDGGDEGGGA
ncbi:MAG TPA: DNA gyrase subunit A [Polyangia bacterium]|jgi:DNA gyrase subunit A